MPAPRKFKDPLSKLSPITQSVMTVISKSQTVDVGTNQGGTKQARPKRSAIEVLLPPSPGAAKLPLTTIAQDVSGSISHQTEPRNLSKEVLSTDPLNPVSLTKKYNKDYLKDRWTSLSGRMMDWLNEGDRLESLMAETKLRDIGVMLGIATEKVLLLDGQPTQIIGQPQHQALDRLGLALKDALDKRGLVTLTERKVDIKIDGPRTPKQTLRS